MGETVSVFGPYGGPGGSSWDDGTHTTIRWIEISAGSYIDSIRVQYDDGGYSTLLSKHGSSDGGSKSMIVLDYPGEFLVSMSGYHNKASKCKALRQLTFKSNKRTYGPFGEQSGEFFSLPQPDGKITGFHGRSGSYVDSIGAYVAPTIRPQPYTIFGPYGGQGGGSWDDGTHTTIRWIEIAAGACIDSIRVEYDDGGRSALFPKHGESHGGSKSRIQLDYPCEFLISMSGYRDNSASVPLVRQLTFTSNKRIYGPFGTQSGEFFSLPPTDGKIIGFHGRSGVYIDSIGVYLSRVA